MPATLKGQLIAFLNSLENIPPSIQAEFNALRKNEFVIQENEKGIKEIMVLLAILNIYPSLLTGPNELRTIQFLKTLGINPFPDPSIKSSLRKSPF